MWEHRRFSWRSLVPQAEEAKKCLAQGGDIVYAAREGLWGAVRHFLKEDPTRAKKADASRREAWLAGFRWGLAVPTGICPTRPGWRSAAAQRRGQTPLHWAAANGHESIVELLLQHGADAGAKDYDGPGPRGRAAGFRE